MALAMLIGDMLSCTDALFLIGLAFMVVIGGLIAYELV